MLLFFFGRAFSFLNNWTGKKRKVGIRFQSFFEKKGFTPPPSRRV